jgi:hypothetical protein
VPVANSQSDTSVARRRSRGQLMARLSTSSPRLVGALAVCAGLATMVLRYNSPEGSFGGLTDDHFFYVTQGWQMLFGELPDRDYFEMGAPLHIAISAGLQLVLGRSVWSEYVFCVAAISVGSAATFALASRASHSLMLGGLAFLFQFALHTRLYNYPKMVVYVAAIGAMWAWASAPGTHRTWLVALITAVAFLLRHDHGVYVGVGFLVLLVFVRGLPLIDRGRQAVIYGATTVALLSPYLIYLQVNGGIVSHFATTYAWAAREYRRSSIVIPSFEWRPLFADLSDAPASEWWEHAPFVALHEHSTFWLFCVFLLLPALATVLLFVRAPRRGTPWTQETAKMAVVVALAVLVVYGFLRDDLTGRLADVSAPMSILAAWVMAQIAAIVRSGVVEVQGRPVSIAMALRLMVAGVSATVVLLTALVLVTPFMRALESGRLMEGPQGMTRGVRAVTDRLTRTWPLDGWATDDRAEVRLARYLHSCTAPTDRVLVTEYRSQILGLAQRGFAAGHVDLRGGGFQDTESEQRLTVERWRKQSVPVVIGPPLDEYSDWVESLPIVARYLESEYHNRGEYELNGFRFLLFERRDALVVGRYDPLGFPCFR